MSKRDRPLRFLEINHLKAILFAIDAIAWLPNEKELYESITYLSNEARTELTILEKEIVGE